MRATIPALRRLVAVSLAVAAAPALAGAQQIPDLPAVRVESVYGLQPTISFFPIARLDDGQASGDLDRVAAGTLTFAHPLPVRDVLFLMFRGTPFSVVLDPAVNGTFTGELTDLSLRQALEAVLVPVGLDFQRRGRVVTVFPRRTETRLFEVSLVDTARGWRRQTGAPGSGGEVSAAVATDVFAELTDGVHALLSPSGKMHVDRGAGIVQVTDFADRLQQVGIYIEAVTLRATRQVRLSARVLDVALTGKAAIDWSAIARDAGLSPGPGAGVRIDDFDRVVRAIGAFGEVRIIASPQILATNNQPALIRIGALDTDAGGGALAVPATFALSITPQIGADGIVHMTVSPAYADERSARSTRLVTEADTVMRLRGGETAVIAGMIRESGGAGDGGAGGGRDRQASPRLRRELVVLLTPTVVSAGSAPAPGAQ